MRKETEKYFKTPLGHGHSTKNGQNSIGELHKEIDLAQAYCDGCPANTSQIQSKDGKYTGFPRCSEGVVTTHMIPAGTIIEQDIPKPKKCLPN